jgi:hypothetical protein
VFGGTPGFKS